MQTWQEKRRRVRYAVRNDVFCEIHQTSFFRPGRSSLVQFGPVLDINEGGMALMYAGRKIKTGRSARLLLKMPDGAINISGVSFRTVSDNKVHDLPNSLAMRRLGVEFRRLSGDQSTDLQHLIQTHTV